MKSFKQHLTEVTLKKGDRVVATRNTKGGFTPSDATIKKGTKGTYHGLQQGLDAGYHHIKWDKQPAGLDYAHTPHEFKKLNEEELTEISKKTLGSYIKKASVDAAARAADVAHSVARGGKQTYKKGASRLIGIEKAIKRLTKEGTDRPFDYAHFHENAYHHHMEKYLHHVERGDHEEGEKHGWAAEHHAAEYHKHTGKKIYDPGNASGSPHITWDHE